MRRIEVEDGLHLRFPRRDEQFNQGVEIGIAAALMASEEPQFTHKVSRDSVQLVLELAQKMRYRVLVIAAGELGATVEFTHSRIRPRLAVV